MPWTKTCVSAGKAGRSRLVRCRSRRRPGGPAGGGRPPPAGRIAGAPPQAVRLASSAWSGSGGTRRRNALAPRPIIASPAKSCARWSSLMPERTISPRASTRGGISTTSGRRGGGSSNPPHAGPVISRPLVGWQWWTAGWATSSPKREIGMGPAPRWAPRNHFVQWDRRSFGGSPMIARRTPRGSSSSRASPRWSNKGEITERVRARQGKRGRVPRS